VEIRDFAEFSNALYLLLWRQAREARVTHPRPQAILIEVSNQETPMLVERQGIG